MSRNVGVYIGSVACVFAVISAHLSFAAFTPAVVSVIATVPMGLIAVLLAARRTGLLALYWSVATVLAFPTVMPSEWSGILYPVYFFGIWLALVLYINFWGSGTRNAA